MTEEPRYADPRLAAHCDGLSPFAADTEFCLALAAEHPGASIVRLHMTFGPGAGPGANTRDRATTGAAR
jgi:hypothetical protein